MSDFWKSVQTIQADYGSTYRSFALLDRTHWAELLAAMLIIAVCAWVYHKCTDVTRHQMLRAVIVLMLADELLKHIVLLYTSQWNASYLPLHLCSINIFVCWYDAVHDSRWSKEILYAVCLPGAMIAMLSPSWQKLPVWNLMHLHSYSVHVMLILYPVLLLAGGFRPQVTNLHKVLKFLVLTATPIFFLNRMLGTNFFFLNDPNGNPVTIFLAHCLGSRFYLLGFFPLIGLTMAILYLPWRRGKQRSETTLL